MLLTDIHCLTDDELVARIASLDGAAKEATAGLIAHLAELESRDLHLALGFKSLYAYCRAVLNLSEHESYSRMEVAQLARRFPVIVPMVAEGLLHMTAVRLLGPHLKDEDHLALLGGAIHKSKVEVKELLARWFPKADVATSIRRIGGADVPRAKEDAGDGGNRMIASEEAVTVSTGGHTNDCAQSAYVAQEQSSERGPIAAREDGAAPPRRKATIDPLSAGTYAVRLTARRATIERLRRAQEILSHAVPDGDVDEVLYRALGAFIEREGKTADAPARRTRRGRRRKPAVDPTSRTITADVEREVHRRDGDRCAFVSKDGRRCEERRFLELHHLKPWIAGGGGSARNIALRCQAHNKYEWKVFVAPIRAAQEVLATRSARTRFVQSGGTS